MANLTKNEEYIVDMYVRYFGKAPSVAEIAKYNEFGKPKLILNEIRGDADDSKASLTTEEFVNNAFQNLFGRNATTKEMNKYSKVVDKGKDLPINAIVKAAKKADKGVYEAKKAIAIMLAEDENTTNYNLDKITKDTYADVYNLKTKKLLVDTVEELEAKLVEIPGEVPGEVPGETFSLTTGVDDGPAFVGTAKNDTYNANLAFNATTNTLDTLTLNSLDVLDGKGGVDTLNFYSNDAATVPLTGTISNIENINIISGAGVTVNTNTSTTITGVENLSAKAIGAAVSLTTNGEVKTVTVSGSATTVAIADSGAKDVLATATISGNSQAVTIASDKFTTLNYSNSAQNATITAAAGTRDLTLNLNKITGGTITDTTATGLTVNNTGAASTLTIAAAAAKAITLNADEKLTLTALNDAVVETLTVKGDSLVTISAGTFDSANLKSIDASASTGGLKLSTANVLNVATSFTGSSAADEVTVGATTKAISMGAGDDTVTMSAAVGTNGSVDAGEGTDTLSMTAANAATASATDTFEKGISNFEKVSIGQVAQATTNIINMANLDDINYLVTAGTAAATVAVKEVFTATITNVATANTDTLAFDGITYTSAGNLITTAAEAAAFVSYYNGLGTATWDAVDNIDGTITFTKKTAGAVSDVVNADFAAAGTISATVAAPTTQGVTAVAAGALTVTNMASNGTVELTGAINAASSVSVKDSSTNGTDVLNVRLNGTSSIVNTAALTVSSVETINITTTDSSSDATTLTNPVAASTILLAAADATTITVSGNHGVNFNGSTLTKVTTLDASGVVSVGNAAGANADQIAATGAVTFTSAVTDKAVTVTTGNGADVISVASINGVSAESAAFLATNVTASTITTGEGNDIITGSAGKDIINAGAGNDTITGGKGADTLTGGAGNDKFVINLATDSTLAAKDIITDFQANTYGQGTNGASTVTGANATATNWTGDVIDLTFATPTNIELLVVSNAADAQTFIQNAFSSATYAAVNIALDSSTGNLYIDTDNNGTIDSVLQLTGVTTITEAAFVI